MKFIIMITAAALVVIVAFSLLVYPTPYRYFEYGNELPIKDNWITGKSYRLDIIEGWKEIKPN